ncbi:protein draper-like isoform X2 [Saccostrea cucullata]|uniref:protein draper-like isoform X2 n=1 Tax=Saccostrea cuccullata TaxID=36930 RepID=UPI002ED28DF5
MSVNWTFVYMVLSTYFVITLSQCYLNGRCICHCDCESGCTSCYKGWSGSKDNVCQRKNIAYIPPKEQIESKDPTVEKTQHAFDENITSFYKTGHNSTQQLLFKFRNIKRIKYLHIISTADLSAFVHLSASTENSTSRIQTQTEVYLKSSIERNITWCGTIQPTMETSDHYLNCTDAIIGSLINIYFNGGSLLLNEIKVYECSFGTYGFQCENICRNCISNQCDGITGICILGCRNGWWGDLCDMECASVCVESCDRSNGHCSKCISGKYGPNCSESCSRNCKPAGICLQDGECQNGCLEGWSGPMCYQKCFDGNCNNLNYTLTPALCEQCNGSKGECQRCRSDYLLCADDLGNCLKCDNGFGNCTECIKGRYGAQCKMNCSDHCIGKDCDFDGLCTLGCEEGFSGGTCTELIQTSVIESFRAPYIIAVSVLGVLCTSFAVLLIRFKMKDKRKKESEMQVTYECSRVIHEADHGYETVTNSCHTLQLADQDNECVREPDYQTIDFCTV